MDMFDVTLFDQGGIVAQGIPMPCVPLEGWKLWVRDELWEVTSVPQLVFGDRDRSFRPDTPVLVTVLVRKGTGIHEVAFDDETLTPQARYEYAQRRYGNAVEDYPRARAAADGILRRAQEEFDAADALLREFEEKPGVPKPEFRERM